MTETERCGRLSVLALEEGMGVHYRQSRNSGEQRKLGDSLDSAEMGNPTGKGKPLTLSLKFQDNEGSGDVQTS